VGKAELRAGERKDRCCAATVAWPMVAVAVTPLPGSNYVAIADAFHKRVAEIKKDLPEDLRYTMLRWTARPASARPSA
jgi:multidrug efflux pump subunit AcrB